MDSTQNINEYDEATQATIRKIMWEQQQKRLVLMSDSIDEGVHKDVLEKAAVLPGSPFV